MPVPGEKYFKGRLYRGGRMYPYVVWDGMHGYKNTPPPELFAIEQLTGTIGIVQLGKKPTNTATLLENLVSEQSFTSVVLWAKTHAVYRAIVEEMEARSDVRLQ